MNSIKGKLYMVIIGFLLIFGAIFSWNYSTFSGIKQNTGYTYGKIVDNWKIGKHRHDYSRYEYQVNGTKFQGKQGDKFPTNKLVVIVYDKENPKFSMIADYPLELINEQNDTLKIEEGFVRYKWWDYLPADKISDLWKK